MNPRVYSLISLCALLALVPSAASAESALPSLGVVNNRGFCPDGVWDRTRWPGGERPDGLSIWGSYCAHGDDDVGRMELQEFLAPPALNLYLAGYAGLPKRRLILKNVQSGQETDLRPASTAGDQWRFYTLPVPPEWVGKPVQLIADDSASGQQGWLGFSIPFLPPTSLVLPAIDTNVPEGGFCANGVYPSTKWPEGTQSTGIITWGSFCKSADASKSGDAGTGWAASQPAIAGAYISFYIAGYPTEPGLRLAVENLQTGRQLLLQVPRSPMETWRLYHFRLPDDWRGQSVRIVAGDQATGSFGWVAFSEPVPSEFKAEWVSALNTLGLVFIYAVFLLVPSVAACMYAAFRGIKDQLDLTAIAFLALGFTGYAAFWMYFCSRILGILFCYAGLLACCAVIAYLVRRHPAKLGTVKQLIEPGILVVLASIFIMSLGLLHGVDANPLFTAAGRFGPPMLSADNEIPKVFADGIYAGHVPKPLIGDWLSSDRPPLQTGNTLWNYAWTPGDRALPYLVISVILQCSFLAALWSFLAVCNIRPKPMALAVAACLFSGFTLLNGFFTWPKLFPVGFLLIVVSYLLTDRYYQVRDHVVTGAIVGAAAALAMLCHGGSMFAVPGIAACMLLLRRYPSRRFLAAMAGAAVLLYLPWTLYQKFYDPPGDRLMKWHIGGAQVGGTEAPRPQDSFTTVLFSNYAKLKAGELIDLKAGNFKTLAGDLPQYLEDAGMLSKTLVAGSASARNTAASFLRRNMFVNWIPGIDLAILGPLVLLLSNWNRRRDPEFIAASRMWLLTGLTLVLWALILFGPVATIPHQGTYLTEVLAFAGSSLAFWAVRPWFAVAITVVHVLWNAILFIWLTPAPALPGVGVDTGPVNFFLGAACLLSAGAICALLAYFALRPAAIPESSRAKSVRFE